MKGVKLCGAMRSFLGPSPGESYKLPVVLACFKCRGLKEEWSQALHPPACDCCAGTGREPMPFAEVWEL